MIKKWSPKAVITKMTQKQPENPDLEPEGNSEETASSETLLKLKGPCYYCNGEKVYERAVVKCPRCFWQNSYSICPIYAHQIPVDRRHLTDGFIWCADCHAKGLTILQAKTKTIDCILIS